MKVQALVCLIAMFFSPLLACAQVGSKEYNEKRKEIAVPWNEMFGKKIDFLGEDKETLFDRMIVAGVWSLKKFKEMPDDAKLSKPLKKKSDKWMKTFFKEKFRPQVKPLKYCLQGENVESTLYYQWDVEKYRFTMFESSAGILLEITDKKGKVIHPGQDEFSNLMESIFNISSKENDIAKQFQLDDKIDEGDVFTMPSSSSYAWEDSIIVFGSKRGLCILLRKSIPGRASKQFPSNPGWLTPGLIFPEK